MNSQARIPPALMQRVNSSSAGELQHIVQSNEEIEAVIHTASGIGISAL